MDREALILGLEHDVLFKEFISFASRELGTIKMNDIISKVNYSNKVGKFLQAAKRINQPLGSADYLGCLHSSTSFAFANAETIAIAAIALLMKWNHEIGIPNFLSDDIHLNKRFFTILDKCDRYKTHLKAGPNFFERFNNHMERILTLMVFKSNTPLVKTEISFDSTLCGAIKNRHKTEFRVLDNLEGINFEPNEWRLEGYDKEKGAKFFNTFLGETILVEYPYKLGSIIKVFDSADSSNIYTQIKIISFYIQRFRDVDETDACKEGYDAYKEKVEQLFIEDPSLDAELCLFEEDWIKKHGSSSLVRNYWLWVFEFKIEGAIIQSIHGRATSAGLSAETIAQLLAIEI